jgi:ribonuclease-3
MAEAHPKGVLMERAQKLGMGRPEFRTERTGPEHEPSFLSDVIVDGEVLGTGQGGSKRTAEKNAADEALAALDARETPAPAQSPSPGSRKRGRGAKAQADRTSAEAATSDTQAPSAPGRTQPRPDAPSAVVDEAPSDDAEEEAPFAGPWPMFDDLLASVLAVAERRVSVELRGEAARVAIRDFSLTLYKELLADLGEVVEEEDEEEED